MLKKLPFLASLIIFTLALSGCALGTKTTSTDSSTKTSGYVTDRTDYTIYYTGSSPEVLGGMATHESIIGHPIPEAETIKYNAYFVPWRIDFSQVQRANLSLWSAACKNQEEQVVEITGWIDLDLSELEVNAKNLPNEGPVTLKGTVHETVTGKAGKWLCNSDIANVAANGGSAKYVESVSGDHVANFSDTSNMTSMTISGADIYLDLSVPENIQFIWPAGTKIEFAPEGTPIPPEPLAPANL